MKHNRLYLSLVSGSISHFWQAWSRVWSGRSTGGFSWLIVKPVLGITLWTFPLGPVTGFQRCLWVPNRGRGLQAQAHSPLSCTYTRVHTPVCSRPPYSHPTCTHGALPCGTPRPTLHVQWMSSAPRQAISFVLDLIDSSGLAVESCSLKRLIRRELQYLQIHIYGFCTYYITILSLQLRKWQ